MLTKRHSRCLRALNTGLLLGLLALSPAAPAGEFADKLSNCLLTATTEEDKLSLVRWMFSAMALHPGIEEIAEVPLSVRERANREMAELLVDLLSIRCYSERQLALQNEGTLALQASFSTLGQIAATNLFSDANVAAGLASLETYISAEDLERRLELGQ